MYTGSLTLEQIATARLKALRNAEELIADAEVLYSEQRWPRALFLSQIAVEEAGKYFYLFSSCAALVDGSIDWKKFWKSIRSHSDKTTVFLMMEDMLLCTGCIEPKLISDFRTNSRILERGKMWSLYADYEQKDFFAPSEVIPKWIVDQAIDLAKKRVGFARAFESSRDWSASIQRMTKSDLERVQADLKRRLTEIDAEDQKDI